MPQQQHDEPLYITWKDGDEQSKAFALAQVKDGFHLKECIVRSQGTDIYRDIDGAGRHIRDGYTWDDYHQYRPEEASSKRDKEAIKQCMKAYDEHGIIRNIIDLMADFATQGIDLNHPNVRIEKFYKEWFRKVDGKERSERFLNYLYRTGNVIVQRRTAKLTPKQADDLKRAKAEPDMDISPSPSVEKREVPWKYIFHNPTSIDVLDAEFALWSGDSFRYAVRVPNMFKNLHVSADPVRREYFQRLPGRVKTLLEQGANHLPLDPKKTKGFYYKRDDWQVWSRPMVYSILNDLNLLRKMKLADISALDGAISSIRVWKIGSLEHRIMPTATAMNRLAEMLMNNVGGGVMDLIWDAAIELLETKTDVHHFLGATKYEPVLTAIYAGLGIPPTLTGAGQSQGFTNNFISLKTLTERLQYGREVLTAFWNEEIRLVQKAMGFRFPATLTFDRMTLSDEASEKQLLLHLADRNYISVETLQERFGETPEIEEVRIRREQRKRENGQMPPMAGPFHNAEKDHDLLKIFSQLGVVTPSELGLELDERKSGEVPPMDQKFTQDEKLKGQPGQGRPPGKKDSQKRKQKVVKPRTSATFIQTLGWVQNTQNKIASFITPAYLKTVNKNSLRELTTEQAKAFEQLKFRLLCQFSVGEEVTKPRLKELMNQTGRIPQPVSELVKLTISKYATTYGEEPPLADVRMYQASAYALFVGDF